MPALQLLQLMDPLAGLYMPAAHDVQLLTPRVDAE
jgi:hypothetical protein